MLFPIIPSRTHGILDYIYVIVVIAVLWIYNFSVYTYAPWIMLIAGICIIIFSMLTRYERGYLGLISMRAHLWLDLLVGVLLIAAPYFLKFEHNAALPHWVMGVILILSALLTKPFATSYPAAGPTPDNPHR